MIEEHRGRAAARSTRGLTSCCKITNPTTDVAAGIYGYSHTMGGYEGGQAEYVRVPFIGVDAEKTPMISRRQLGSAKIQLAGPATACAALGEGGPLPAELAR